MTLPLSIFIQLTGTNKKPMLTKIDEATWLVGFAILTLLVLSVWIPGIVIIALAEKSTD